MPKDSTNHLPVVEAVAELQESNKDGRERLQKSLRAGLLNVKKSIDSLSGSFERSLVIQGEAQQQLFESNLEFQERSLEQGKHAGHLMMSKLTAIGAFFVAFFENELLVELRGIKDELGAGVKEDSKGHRTSLGQLSSIRKILEAGDLKKLEGVATESEILKEIGQTLFEIKHDIRSFPQFPVQEIIEEVKGVIEEQVEMFEDLPETMAKAIQPSPESVLESKREDEIDGGKIGGTDVKPDKEGMSFVAKIAMFLLGGTLLMNLDKVYDGLKLFAKHFGFIADFFVWAGSIILPFIGKQLDWIAYGLAAFFGGKFIIALGAALIGFTQSVIAMTIMTIATARTFFAMAGVKLLAAARWLALGVYALMAMFAGSLAALTPVLAAAAPFVAAIVAIGAALYILYQSFKDAKAEFDKTGSIWEALKAGWIGIPKAVIRTIKDMVSWIAEFIGFDKISERLDAIDTDKIFDNIVKSITDVFNKIGDWFVKKWDSLTSFFTDEEDPVIMNHFENLRNRRMQIIGTHDLSQVIRNSQGNSQSGGVNGAVIDDISALQKLVSQPPIIIDNSSAPTAVDASSTTSISNTQHVEGQAGRRKRAQENRERRFNQ
jgi:hypothetical protein